MNQEVTCIHAFVLYGNESLSYMYTIQLIEHKYRSV